MRVAIAGITGRMGRLLEQEVRAAGLVLAGGSSRTGGSLSEAAAAADVVIDFTNAAAVQDHARILAAHRVAWVLGTSGLSAADEAAVQVASQSIPIVYAANFAPGVVLVLALAERMAAALPAERYDAEIMEMHHRQKVDAPSGTAIGLGRAVAKGRGVAFEAVANLDRSGHTGARKPGAIGFASLRGGQVVGEHTLLFAAGDEHVALTHRAFDRRAFAVGAVQAARWLGSRPAGLYDMMDVLDMRASPPPLGRGPG